MVAVKAYQADAFLRVLGPEIDAVLVYGGDPGLISERARLAAQRLAERESPHGEILRIEDADLELDPDRLSIELQTAPMFGGRKVVRTTAGRKVNAQLLQPLLAPGALAGTLVVEAGNLRPDDPLRTLFERAKNAAAIACYQDESRDIAAVVRESLATAGLEIATEARELLQTRLGADRALTRREIDKLVLFAHGKKRIEVEDVEAIVGDASELAIDAVLIAAAAGDAAKALTQLDRAVASGESPQTVIAAAQRYFQRLHRIRAAMDSDRSFDEATRALRPPIHFRQKAAIEAQARAWTAARLTEAIARISDTACETRLSPLVETQLAERILIDIAGIAAQVSSRDRRSGPQPPL